MKVKLNPMFEAASGQLGELVFREVRGKTIVSRMPTLSGEPTAEQIAHRDRFKQAAAYGKSVMANSSLRAMYEEVAKAKDVPVFALTVADFLNLPSIVEVDASEYNGQAGGSIKIQTSDDFGVASVKIDVYDADAGTDVESGQAIETSEGYWTYTATSNAAAGILVGFQVTVTDRPGGTVNQRGTKQI